eukprot:602366-Rhodomonas_salina.3
MPLLVLGRVRPREPLPALLVEPERLPPRAPLHSICFRPVTALVLHVALRDTRGDTRRYAGIGRRAPASEPSRTAARTSRPSTAPRSRRISRRISSVTPSWAWIS